MNILRFDSQASWVQTVTSLWRDRLREQPRLRMCLPSGRTPIKIYDAMRESAMRGAASFRHAEVFALDEYGGLAPDDPGLCVNMLRRDLVDRIDLPEERFHVIDVHAPDLDRVCRDYDGRIAERPFDLTLLGIGMNGHIGLNEPGSPLDSVTRRVEMHATTIAASAGYLTHARLPTWGVGVGLKHLLASTEVWLLANGSAKADIVRQTVHAEIGADLPASWLRTHPNSFMIVDADAGAGL
jgi:glucosamine-6-phosphate deaminase